MAKNEKNNVTIGLAIFVKTIGLSAVKTRLAKTIGHQKAEKFYRLSLEAIKALVDKIKQNNDALTAYWAVAEKNGQQQPSWQNLPTLWSGAQCSNADYLNANHLGLALNYVYQSLLKKHQFAIMIGSDSPQLNQQLFEQTIAHLTKNPHSCVIGPCLDGGFYLFASSIDLDKNIWQQVRYSQRDTYKQLMHQLKKNGITVQQLPTKTDVDNSDDLTTLLTEFKQTPTLLNEQKTLINWLENNAISYASTCR